MGNIWNGFKGLEKKGLLRKEYLKTDKRIISIIPQPKSKKVIAEITNKFDQVNNFMHLINTNLLKSVFNNFSN